MENLEKDTKIAEFLREYEALTKKYGVDFLAYPSFIPDKDGKFVVVINTQPILVEEKKQSWFK